MQQTQALSPKKHLLSWWATETFFAEDVERVVLHVQNAMSALIEKKLGAVEVTGYQAKQADLVLEPIKKFLEK